MNGNSNNTPDSDFLPKAVSADAELGEFLRKKSGELPATESYQFLAMMLMRGINGYVAAHKAAGSSQTEVRQKLLAAVDQGWETTSFKSQH